MSNITEGTKVRWTSQSGGVEKTKEGVVVAVIEAGKNPFYTRGIGELLEATPKSRIKFDGGERIVIRVLVEVPRGGKSKLSDFYCPHASQIEEVPADGR